jgi:hypothetical protein
MMASTTIPMPRVLAGEALADRPNRSLTPALLLGAFGGRGSSMLNLLTREAPRESTLGI